MATQTKGGKAATQTAQQPAVATLVFNPKAQPVAAAAKRPNTARARTVALAQQYNGKPLADFEAAWLKAAKAGRIHHSGSVFTKGTSKSAALAQQGHQAFSGWLSWLVRTNVVTVKQ